jgi:CO/xanthine dehydrogenase FAD-binding subunit
LRLGTAIFAIAGVAFQLEIAGGTVSDGRLVYFASEKKPTLAHEALAARRGDAASGGRGGGAVTRSAADLQPTR